MANLEDVRKCPKCGCPGEHVQTHTSDKDSKVYIYRCTNDRCKWFSTSWIVQVLKDGSIPERRKGDPEFPTMGPAARAVARHLLEEAAHLPTELPNPYFGK